MSRLTSTDLYVRVCNFYFSTKTYGVGTQKNHLNEMVLLRNQKQILKLKDKNILQFYSEIFAHLDLFLIKLIFFKIFNIEFCIHYA